ncbi:efflux RND transporter periplasmic adaptor subunit [Litoribrevibacter albus]|uniref:RND transporter n=1 Tax=Litoribrevibacter albus TaxID=1473156 RepID=A0AA37SE81_9GAMM|nr:efflux RND transporter periplasmic adaptor subunit [Litoribrevibacter albus]GLQ32657.1 RND transporter [Litoribrevibacter albus]
MKPFILLLSVAFTSAMLPLTSHANPPINTVDIETVEDAVSFYSSGLVANKAQSRLSFKTSGIVQKITVDDGQQVRKGQLLAQLDLSEIQAQQRQAQADFKQASLDVTRLETLVAQRLAPKEKLDNALIRKDKAKAALNIAEFNLKHSQIIAPASGVVITKHIEMDELISAGQPVITFSPNSKGWVVKAGLIDREAVYVNLGDTTTIELDAYPGQRLEGEVTEIAAQANPNTGLFEVEISINEEPFRLLSGLYAHINVHPQDQPVLYRVPTSSLLTANGKQATVAQMNPVSRSIEMMTVNVHSLSTDSVLISNGLNTAWPIVTGSPYNFPSQLNAPREVSQVTAEF